MSVGVTTGIEESRTLHLSRFGFEVFTGVRRKPDWKAFETADPEQTSHVFLDVTDAGAKYGAWYRGNGSCGTTQQGRHEGGEYAR